jgi:hypothetical protein
MKTEIVVARYNENLDWLKKIKKSKDIKITVYNKGKDDIDVPFIKLPNIGRESHTYLYHIIHNYDKLADQTIFCQGDSIFHSPDFLDLINKYRKKFEPVQPLTAWYWPEEKDTKYEQWPPKPILDATKNLWINGKARIHVQYLNNDFINLYPYHYNDNAYIKLIEKFKSLYGIENPLKFNVERFRLKDVDLDYLFPMSYAAIFAVNKESIQDNSVDFYNNIMSILIYDIRPSNKPLDQGLFLEKLWLVIFNYKKYNKNYIKLKVKDYKLKNYTLRAKNNICNFSYFNIFCNLYITVLLDNNEYSLFISKYIIYVKKVEDSKLLYKYNIKDNKHFMKILKDMCNYNVSIRFNNNILQISINNNILINYNFNKNNVKHNIKYKKLGKVIVYDIAKYNKLIYNI